jgi:YbbR domain-containing protein
MWQFSNQKSNLSRNLKPAHLWQKSRQWLKNNPKMKITVFLFTMVLWFFVVLSNNYSYTFDARLEIKNLPSDRIIASNIPRYIQANFSGKGLDLFYLLFSQRGALRFIVDVSSIKKKYNLQLDEYFRRNNENIVVPRGLAVKYEHIVWPETLRIEIDVLNTIKVPVFPDIEIQPAPGYIVLGNPTLSPDSITISGPETALSQLALIQTKKLTLKNVTGTVSREIELLMPSLQNLRLNVKKVNFQQVVDQLSERKYDNVPVIVTGTIAGTRVEAIPATVSVNLTGGLSVLRRLKAEDISVVVDLKDWKSNAIYYTPVITLPEGVISYSQLNPEKIEIRVIRERF